MNPLSNYDLWYVAMPEEVRKKINADINAIIAVSSAETQKTFLSTIEKAVTEMYNQTIINPWSQWVKENADGCDFLGSVKDYIWSQLIKSNPEELGEWKMRELVASWQENYPEEWANIVNEEAAETIKGLKQSLEFERQATRGY